MSQFSCRSCNGTNLTPILSLGQMPLANAFLKEEELQEFEPRYPLDLVYCPDCTLVQITETVAPEKLFREYLYLSSFADTMVHHAQNLVEQLMVARHLSKDSLVVEIASNDGYLLQHYQGQGIPVLGIEPAVNIAQFAQEKRGIRTVPEFFDVELALQLRQAGHQADIIHAHNVLAHVVGLNSLVSGIQVLLKEDGLAVIEVPYVKNLIDRCAFDTIYHEHLCYFSLTALNHLFKRHNLTIQNVQQMPIHGGSLRLFVTQALGGQPEPQVYQLLQEEQAWGVAHLEYYRQFASSIENLKTNLHTLLLNLKQQGKRLAAYGAAAKGTILLNYLGIGPDVLDFVVDRSVYKQGRYIPGVHLPIYPPQALLEYRPDYVLLLTWNLADEILTQQVEFRYGGGKFILPIPEIKII